jgi:hypothetical protein
MRDEIDNVQRPQLIELARRIIAWLWAHPAHPETNLYGFDGMYSLDRDGFSFGYIVSASGIDMVSIAATEFDAPDAPTERILLRVALAEGHPSYIAEFHPGSWLARVLTFFPGETWH